MNKNYCIGEKVKIIKPEEDYGCIAKVWEVNKSEGEDFYIKISYTASNGEYIQRTLRKIVD